MQTERVTYLTSAEHKSKLEAFAKARGESVGSVVREATTQYMAKPEDDADEERLLKMLVDEINEAAPRILASMDRLSEKMQAMHKENDAFLRQMGVRK
jgi:hypothetical protein